MAEGDWSFEGWATSRHLEPLDLPPSRYLSLIWYWATDGKDHRDVEKFRRWVYMTLPGQVVLDEDDPEDSPWSAEAQNASLASFEASMRG